MCETNKYQSASDNVSGLGTIVPKNLVEVTGKALSKLKEALDGDVSGYVAKRLCFSLKELANVLVAEQVDGIALALYNIEKRSQSVVIGDQTGIGKGRQAAAMIRYGLLSGYLPVFFTDRYTLFSDMYRDCKALGIKEARPLVVNAGVSVVDFDYIVEEKTTNLPDEIWSSVEEDVDMEKFETQLMQLYQKQYKVVYKAPKKSVLQDIFASGDIPVCNYDYLMVTYSQLKDAKRDTTRLDFLYSLCEKHRVLFIFDEAHRGSSVSAGKVSVITQGINKILTETEQTQCVFLSATFAKRPESLITFMHRTALSSLASENTLEQALHSGGVPMQEYVSLSLAAEGQMVRREHSSEGFLSPVYTYLDEELAQQGELFDRVMFFFREIVKLATMVDELIPLAKMQGLVPDFKTYPTRSQLFYINKVLLLSLKSQKVAQVAIEEVRQGRSVVIGMSDTLECILRDVMVADNGSVRGDISALLLRLLDKTVYGTNELDDGAMPVFEMVALKTDSLQLFAKAEEVGDYYKYIKYCIKEEVFHLPMSPIDIIRQLITKEQFVSPDGNFINIRFEECTGRAYQLEYLSPEGDDDFMNAVIQPRKKRHSNHIFNDFQNNKLDVILINACGAIGASAHAIATAEVSEDHVRQRKMLIVQNDLDVNIDLQKRGRINRTGQRTDLPPLYEYIITAIPSEKRLNMMLRAKLRSLSANTSAWQDQDKEQADFIDICNKYGNEVVNDYLAEHQELAVVLGLKGKTTASILLARIAMLSVTTQQDIVDDLMSAYTSLEAELRRINQWDLEREFHDFEAKFVSEELFTTLKGNSKLGGCSYLTTYKCRQKTFPYTFEKLKDLCEEAEKKYGQSYKCNSSLKKQIRDYYSAQNRVVKEQFKERYALLHAGAKRILVNYCLDENQTERWLQRAQTPSPKWNTTDFRNVKKYSKAKQIMRKLTSFSDDYNHLLEMENRKLKKISEEKKRLIMTLSNAKIGVGYRNISDLLANEECPNRVIAVLRDIRFGKENKNRFQPGKVEFVFALTAVNTEIRINLVHNKKWSNFERLQEILDSPVWTPNAGEWDREIARNNNKIVERKIITGNILGAYVHPAIAELKPRFITFSLKNKDKGKVQTQNGLLLPLDESKIREAIKSVSVPLHEGVKYATNTNTSYPIMGLNVNFSLLPYRVGDLLKYVISVKDQHSKIFENDTRFDGIRSCFQGIAISSIYDKEENEKCKRKPLMRYQTSQLDFKSEEFQTIIQTLSQLDMVLIVPRDQMTYGDVKKFVSRSERDENEPWPKLNWKNANEIPKPPIYKKPLLHIFAPIVPKTQKGEVVSMHSNLYLLAEETMSLDGLSLNLHNTIDAMRQTYIQWKRNVIDYSCSQNNNWYRICRKLQMIMENKSKFDKVDLGSDVRKLLQKILDSECLDTSGQFLSQFDKELLFLSPEKSVTQAFLDEMPCSPQLEGIRKCIQDYLDGKTEIICSPPKWYL